MPLADRIKSINQPERADGIVWSGPAGDGPNGGVTFSLLSRYLACKERFRIYVIEGLKPVDSFNARMEFGNMWHVCEEYKSNSQLGASAWEEPLEDYCSGLCDRYRLNQQQINHWYEICEALFSVYVDHWSKHPTTAKITPLLQEQVFDVPYKLPSGRVVRLRGKWDGVELIEDENGKNVSLAEHKTKSAIDSGKLSRQLTFDLQTMLYLIALKEECSRLDDSTVKNRLTYQEGKHRHHYPLFGVKYNVIRRSAHKSVESMLEKIGDDRNAGRIGEWFARWEVPVNHEDYNVFKQQCLDPLLENLLDDYEWWEFTHSSSEGNTVFGAGRHNMFPDHYPRHYRFPYGVWNVIAEGGYGDVDEYMMSGSTAGLQRVTTLFPELER